MLCSLPVGRVRKGLKLNRRTFLSLCGIGAASLFTPQIIHAAPRSPAPALTRLRERIAAVIGSREIGLDLRRINPETNAEFFRISINAEKLYPVASCFKMFLVLYYFWHTPRPDWQYQENSPIYRVAVFSDNIMTAVVLDEVGGRIDIFGNAIQKFNDFLIYTLGIPNGLYRWNWEETVTEGLVDWRFAPSEERYVIAHGTRYRMDNLFTAADLANGYAMLLDPARFTDYDQADEAIAQTLALLSIPAANYQSPIERVFPGGYTGKDGVLRADESAIGRVINDAGIVQVGGATYILSFMCAGEGEWVGLEVLRQIAQAIDEYEGAT